MTDEAKRLVFENASDPDHEASFVLFEDAVIVAVSDEKAVDSYNRTFECSFTLGSSEAKKLRDWLLAHFPVGAT